MDTTPLPIPILCAGDGWFVADKPAGCETVSRDEDCLTERLRRERANPGLAPIHRLDRDTSGCVLFADRPDMVEPLVEHFNRIGVYKCYLGICHGSPRDAEGTIELPLSEWSAGHRPVQVKPRGGLSARTDYRVVFVGDPIPQGRNPALTVSLIAFRLHTGRTHQIRVHASECGFPILGDDQYGSRPANKTARDGAGLRRQALHAFRLGFPDPASGAPVLAESRLPDDLVAVCERYLPDWKNRLNKAAKKLLPPESR